MAVPTIVGVGASAAGQAAITPAFPAAYSAVADDVAVTFHECDSTDTLNIPSGWALVVSQSLTSGTTSKLSAIWRRLQAGDTAPSIADAGNHQIGRMIVLRGCITTGDPWDVAQTATELTADASVSTPAVTTTVADCLVLAAFSTGQDTNSSAGATGWANASLASVTERMDDWTALGTGGGFSMASGGKATAGSVSATTATLSLTANFKALLTVAFKPAVPLVEVDGSRATTVTLTGTAAADHVVAGDLAVTVAESGTAALTLPGAGDLTVTATLTGDATVTAGGTTVNVDGNLTTTAALTGTAQADHMASGTLTVTATGTSTEQAIHPADGSLIVTSTRAGTASVFPGIDGTLTLTAALSGTAATAVAVAGNAPVAATLTGAADVAAPGQVSIAGDLTVNATLAGSAALILPTSGNLALAAVMAGDATVGQVFIVEVAGNLIVEAMFTSQPPVGILTQITSTRATALRTTTPVGVLRTGTDIAAEVT